MRIRKKDLIEIIKQLQDVNDQIGRNGELIEGLDLAECQELAVRLGNYIEGHYNSDSYDYRCEKDKEGKNTSDGENTVVAFLIHTLEDYCELIYQMSLPENSTSNQLYKLSKKIRKALNVAQNFINHELPNDRKQIVFLPYKASMWDSLESIWMAAKEDSNVDTYVIPIPYFDRNPDGTFGEMHYEGNEYPDYVPITDWQKYSIPDEKPDVIFIHNPYDECNYVTSVHPQYYSRELKKYTDCLVYVPYFVLDGNGLGYGYTDTSACINADYTIAQNEREQFYYVKDLTTVTGNPDYKKRILALGSPKFDKVFNISSENVNVPNKWKENIESQKPKMVLLYNTSVGSLLRQDGAQYINKLQYAFQKCNEANIFILWRPHPLMEATFKSMRADYYNLYIQLKTTFIENRWGIIDELPEMYPAIFVSDAYCGDLSSMVCLYDVTKKPVYISAENTDNYWFLNDDGREFGSIKEDIMLQKTLERSFISWKPGYPKRINGAGKRIYEQIVLKQH